MEKIQADKIPRVPGTAVFLTRSTRDTPPVMMWHVKHNRALHEQLFVLRVAIKPVPWVALNKKLIIKEVSTHFWRAEAYYGFMERPDIPALMSSCAALGCNVDISDLTYYIGHETIISREDGKGIPVFQEYLFAMMERNASHITDFFSLPSDQVVEIGRQISI